MPTFFAQAMLATLVAAGAAQPSVLGQIFSQGLDVTLTAKEIYFDEQVVYAEVDGAGVAAKTALKLVLHGDALAAVGPLEACALGSRPADAVYSDDEGKTLSLYFFEPGRIRNGANVACTTQDGKTVSARHDLDYDKVQWLTPELRKRNELPDLRARMSGR